MKQTIITDT